MIILAIILMVVGISIAIYGYKQRPNITPTANKLSLVGYIIAILLAIAIILLVIAILLVFIMVI